MKHLLLTAFLFISVPAFAADPINMQPGQYKASAPNAVSAEPLAPLPGGDVMITGEGPAEPVPAPGPGLDLSNASTPESHPEKYQKSEGQLAAEEQASAICQTVQTMGNVQGPNYVPGVDAYGRPVAPADVSSTPAIDVPEQVDFPVELDVAGMMNFPIPTQMNVVPGTVRVFKDGRVLYNGQDVSGPTSAYCNQLKPELNVNVQ